MSSFIPRAHLDYNRLQAAHALAWPGRVPLHGPLGRPKPGHDGPVGRHDGAAWQDVAEEEERHGVGARLHVMVGAPPVDAAGRAVGLGTVLAPARQRGRGEQQGVRPGAAHEPAAVAGVEPVPYGVETMLWYR